ncbi:hypothetical protein [Streptomyces sp. NPDC002537]
MQAKITDFKSPGNETGVVSGGTPLTLSWTYDGAPDRLTLKGPDGILIDGKDPASHLIPESSTRGHGSIYLSSGLRDTCNFLLTLTDTDGTKTSQYFSLTVTDPDRTFRRLTVHKTLTLTLTH